MTQKTVENIVEISLVFKELSMEKLLRLPEDRTAVGTLKEKVEIWSDEFEQTHVEAHNYPEEIRAFAKNKFEEEGWLKVNTKITYLYRDASNYKKWNECIVKGRMTGPQVREILSCCNDGMYFIPSQVGLPEEKFPDTTEDDHCWFELDEGSFQMTQQPATEEVTVEGIVEAFRESRDNWRDWM